MGCAPIEHCAVQQLEVRAIEVRSHEGTASRRWHCEQFDKGHPVRLGGRKADAAEGAVEALAVAGVSRQQERMVDAMPLPERHAVCVVLDDRFERGARLDIKVAVRIEPDEQELRIERMSALPWALREEADRRALGCG